MYFWTKKRIIDEISEINNLVDKNLVHAIDKIKELKQDKLYVIAIPDADHEDILSIHSLIQKVKKEVPWTTPTILILNKELNEIDINELKARCENV